MSVFVMVMLTTAFFVNKISNRNMDRVSREMTEPTLPVVYCLYQDRQINMMQGYTQVMSTSLMRDRIVPLREKNTVDVLINDSWDEEETYSYQLRSIAGDSLIEEGDIENWTNNQGYKQFSVSFRMDMRRNREYMFVFIITNSRGESARYYTRVVNLDEEYAGQIIDYVMDFHNTTFEKEPGEEGNIVSLSLDEKADASNDNLYHVNLNSSYGMVSWGGMDPAVMTNIVPTITELDEEYAVVKLSYLAETTQDGNTHHYNVNEYYSAVYDRNSNTVKLLAFDRYIDSIFDSGYISKSRNSLCMGISDMEKIKYASTTDNRRITFVKGGQLWYFDYDKSCLTNVFSFQQNKYTDIRTLNDNLGINIASMDEDGNICFIVYGYMSRGKHEGENGIAMYRFTVDEQKIEELFFVECDEPFDVMKEEIGRFSYYDGNGCIFYLLDGAIYKINMENGTMDTLMYGLPSDKYMVSDNCKLVAYPDNANEDQVRSINVYNFETGELFTQSKEEGDRLMAFGFVGNDLIYGVSRENDILRTSDGEVTLPMYALYIIRPDGTIVKEYREPGTYIMNAKVLLDKIYLTRANRLNGFYEEIEPDYISYKPDSEIKNVTLSYNTDARELKQVDLKFPSDIYLSEKNKFYITKSKEYGNYLDFRVKTTTMGDSFYVFNNSGYSGEYSSAGRAIVAVSEDSAGLVVDSNGNTIYRDIAATSYNTVAAAIDEHSCGDISDTLMTCAYMCIEYLDSRVEYESVMKYNDWEEAFENLTDGVGINISGISLDIALYFLDRDVPFAAKIDDGRYVLVISYNSTHIRYYDPILDEEVRVTRSSFANSMSLQGNTMFTYTSQ